MSIRCVNKCCGWYKDFEKGIYKSNCKMAGITQCDFSSTITSKSEKTITEEQAKEKFESHYTGEKRKDLDWNNWLSYKQALIDFGILD